MAAYSRTVTFTSPGASVRQTAAKRTARIQTHYQHTRYVRRFTNTFRAR
jgi:hypothetical protein